MTTRPWSFSGSPPPSCAATRATRSTSADGPSHITRASRSSWIAVRPGVATTARSQSSRKDDDVPIGLGSLGRRLDAVELLQPQMHDLALDGRHRIELGALTAREHLLCRAHR